MPPPARSTFALDHRTPARGQSLVEFALVLILLLVIAAGAVDLGRAFHSTIIITNASREGARYLTRHPDDAASAFSGTKNAAVQEAGGSYITLQPADVTVLPNQPSLPPGTEVTVTVGYTFEPVMGFILPDELALRRSTSMMVP